MRAKIFFLLVAIVSLFFSFAASYSAAHGGKPFSQKEIQSIILSIIVIAMVFVIHLIDVYFINKPKEK